MRLLIYNDLNPDAIPNFAKLSRFLDADDFRSAEVKKVGPGLYRARLDSVNRILFTTRTYAGERYALILEFIPNHAYDKSRFLARGTAIDDNKIPAVAGPADTEAPPLPYVNPHHPRFHLLDKIISFDEQQDEVFRVPPPLIVIGSAGSGKTVLTLEKMKQTAGDVLYVTRSPYLVQNARALYYASGYETDAQSVDFLSFQEVLESIAVPPGREMTMREFTAWHGRQHVPRALRDPHQVFEEFKGVLTGAVTDAACMPRDEYLGLGIKQSIFLMEDRPAVYDLFVKYLRHMAENSLYDANMVSYAHLQRAEPRYDFLVVDEVQDLTNIQLQLILALLRDPRAFILSGDSNQIVHPNFFSWSKLKTFFYQQEATGAPADLIRILHTNYRNTPEVTELANRILKLKHARFGSIDRESNYLVHSTTERRGTVLLLRDREALRRELDAKTRQSTRFAVIVMHPEQKAAAHEHFSTPLVFSIQEAKGLEYENIILYNFTSGDKERFDAITSGVNAADVANATLAYGRARDKGDKSLEIYKFHINALYVAVTRAVANVYLLEEAPEQPLFELLGLKVVEGALDIEAQKSSLEEWRAEARRLELQGKQEQADEIRSRILQLQPVPWTPLTAAPLAELQEKALSGDKNARVLLFEYALVHNDQNRIGLLARAGFAAAGNPERGRKLLEQKHYMVYDSKSPMAMLRQIERYGVDFRDVFNHTPLMNAARLGNEPLVERLITEGADTEAVNNVGFNAFRIALGQALADPRYARQRLAAVYTRLVPESESVQAEGRLIKLDNRSMEFLLLNLMMVMFYSHLGEKVIRSGAFQSGDFVEVLKHFPDGLVPERRKQRPYISSILAKNEVDRDDRYNRKLFQRLRQGHYILDPGLRIRIAGEWHDLYDILDLELVGFRHRAHDDDWTVDFRERNLQTFRKHVRRLRPSPAPPTSD
jgi:hypothetical protein